MDLLLHLHRQFAYDAWANQETLAALRSGTPPPRSLKYLAHLISAEWLWLGRLKQWRQESEVWPAWTVGECEAQAGKLPPLWQEYLGRMRPGALAQIASYTNSKGETWTNSIGDVLSHVLLHSAYHRGQIATDMRAAGLTPAYTDFIHAVRQGFVR
ncbi:MAG: hypothetical protein E6K76_07215 [Candidatus Eisenbacteria bacterium]|uniref:Damage-inducible protein DinB n=1 Tax=Eiseniibacteriota bacterium TaxID=2212470 RepID=A0A538T4X1_UNCEI|nr:MAG: hypothetical protein E6K76_07215 [Candidatus Eisenbacteria bacterium]